MTAPQSLEPLVHRWMEEGWNQRNPDAIENCFASDFVFHDPYDGSFYGHAGVRGFFDSVHSGLADLSVRVDDLIEEGNRVAARITVSGTHADEFAGRAPSGAQITFPALLIADCKDDRFREIWQHWDLAGVLATIENATGETNATAPPVFAARDLGKGPARSRRDPVEETSNKEVVRHWLTSIWNERDAQVVDELIAEEHVFMDANSPAINGPEGMRDWISALHSAFDQMVVYPTHLIAEGDKVACRLRFQAKHIGDLFGRAATDKTVDAGALFFVRLSKGRFLRAWQSWDLHSVLQQIDAG